MKKALLLIVLWMCNSSYSQAFCTSNEELGDFDVNEISISKCRIDDSKPVINTSRSKQILSYSKRLNKKKVQLKRVSQNKSLRIKHSDKKTKLSDIKKNINSIISLVDDKDNTLSYLKVEEAPQFIKGKGSFRYQMKLHLDQHLVYPKEALQKGIEGELLINFIITKEGLVKNINVSSKKGTDILKIEAIRVVSLLPKFRPAEHKGISTNVTYNFPMYFTLN